ncbi:MAG: hypothetical protein JJT89_05555 [Nitriliruptoraceae bacterium]|nr:hypothetical protein [Nitriliruptoraceae bacterium]
MRRDRIVPSVVNASTWATSTLVTVSSLAVWLAPDAPVVEWSIAGAVAVFVTECVAGFRVDPPN